MIVAQQSHAEALEILENSMYDNHTKQSKRNQFQYEMDQVYHETTGISLEEAYDNYVCTVSTYYNFKTWFLGSHDHRVTFPLEKAKIFWRTEDGKFHQCLDFPIKLFMTAILT